MKDFDREFKQPTEDELYLNEQSRELIKHTRQTAELLGFTYRASGNDWITFTYPNTNTHVVHIDIRKSPDIMRALGDALVICGKIQLRQNFLREFSPFNYGE
jgi:hypothetical protein